MVYEVIKEIQNKEKLNEKGYYAKKKEPEYIDTQLF